MKISSITIENYKCFGQATTIKLDDFTAFIGKNDAGKSTILEAIALCYGSFPWQEEDLHQSPNGDRCAPARITLTFTDLPKTLILDEDYATNLKDERLLNTKGELEFIHTFGHGCNQTFLKAVHPHSEPWSKLHSLNNMGVKKLLKELKPESNADKRKNGDMRKEILDYLEQTQKEQFKETDLEFNEHLKAISKALLASRPTYHYLRVDRVNNDSDTELQDPGKEILKAILQEDDIQDDLKKLSDKLNHRLQSTTHEALKIAKRFPGQETSFKNTLGSVDKITPESIYKSVNLVDDQGIKLNKHGSGLRRLVLLNTFIAIELHKKGKQDVPNCIFAIEEPEVNLHHDLLHQLLKQLQQETGSLYSQCLIASHSSEAVLLIPHKHLRIISLDNGTTQVVPPHQTAVLKESRNEACFIAFGMYSASYHNELYGELFMRPGGKKAICGWHKRKPYQRLDPKTQQLEEQKPMSLCTVIRHMSSHPENHSKLNSFTEEELRESTDWLREQLIKHPEIDSDID